ncbi:branched-chain amino acid ABC transporter permease [Noviherbaspirillum cavernae]|uniref:Branched-chain amino acid ABC transporter permease n=1 Tax=Noviherbaspirillum cavernae TaxID=2320862 RepID=A0A418WX48_9BURK|nr:branched-chain amino acid ABC transporter permease [Noviherbaspirillum cavernae]RJG04782.1 branched-chain amino acid ABC transporter permease [Noviherbaspirillum cavernae]
MYWQIITNGLLLGGLYSCIAAGFSLVWGVLNIINILHGSLIVLGAYLAYFAHAQYGLNPFVIAVPVGLATFVFGYVIQRVSINRVIGKPVLITLSLTFGLDLILNDSMISLFQADYRKISFDPPLPIIEIGSVLIPVDRLIATAISLACVVVIWILLRSTRLGRAIIAVRADIATAPLMGIRVHDVYALSFAIAAALAGISGALLAAIFPISPLMAGGYLSKSFAICVFGGLGNLPGAIAGGLALGLIESLASAWFGPQYMVTVSFCVLLALLYFKPNGMFGKRGFE